MLSLLSLLVITLSARTVYGATDTNSTTLIPASTEATYTNFTPLTQTEPTYDYVVNINFTLDETKVPEYLVNVIYDQAFEKSITTEDVVNLYGLKAVDRNTTIDFLRKLNIPPESVFSLDGLDKFLTELKVDFKEFYNRVFIDSLNITGNPLRDVLDTLNISSYNFSLGMAYGDPDPYDEFKKGDFSYETVTLALQRVNRTLDDLFIACRDEFVTNALLFAPKTIVDSLLRYGFGRTRALSLWNILELNMSNVYNISSFKLLIDDMVKELNQAPHLGVLTATNGISINRKVYEIWKKDKNISQPLAMSITGAFSVLMVDTILDELENIITLRVSALVEPYEETTTIIEVGEANGDIQNCRFITLHNETVVVDDVGTAVTDINEITIPKGNVTELVMGSPLICDNKVYGLAREISGDNIVLDSFRASGVNKIFLHNSLFGVVVACLLVYLL